MNQQQRRAPPARLLATASACLLLGLGGTTLAQPSGAAGAAVEAAVADQLPQVSVTAKGYEAATVETPAAVEVISAEDIRRKGATSLGQSFVGQPGLSVTSDGGQNMNPVVRGLKKESLVLMVDGMRMNSAQPYGAIGSFVSMGLAERVEVVKGPASVLYGAGALGGAVNVLLPQARFEPGTSGRLGLRAASGDRSLGAAAVLNWSGGDHALMVGGAGAGVGDYRADGRRIERTGHDNGALIGQYRWRLDAAQQLRLSLQREDTRNLWYPGSLQPNPMPQIGSTMVHSPRQLRQLAEIGYSHQNLAGAKLDVRLYRQEVERSIYVRANGPLNRETAMTDVSFGTTGLDARADWALGESHLLSLGFNGWQMSASPDRRMFNAGQYVANNPFADGRLRAAGVYLQDDMRFGKLGVVAGLRYDRVTGKAASVGNGAVTDGLQRSDGAWSGSLGVMVEVHPLLRPYASLARGFRAGEMRERFEASPRGDGYFYLGNPQIRPETAQQFELGVKGQDERLQWFASIWRSRIGNYITGVDTGGFQNGVPVRNTVNLGSVRLSGLELGARWEFARRQWLGLSYSRIRGTNRDLGEPLYQMPADELNVSWEAGLAGGWSADVWLRHAWRQDRVATVFARGTEQPSPGFTTLGLGASWQRGPHQLRLAVHNLTNKTYREHLAEGLPGYKVPAPGRSFVVQYQLEF